jgi:ATPase subunit of ABC transporter with duplicated ATPase domains
VKWAEKAKPGYFAQDHSAEFEQDANLTDWIAEYARISAASTGEDVETLMRGTLGRLLFSGDDVKKSLKVISGGEQGRMLFGKLMLSRPNILLMDEPTNHLDMESIESLNNGLDKFNGTLIFISHDREFVSSLATRIIEIRLDGSITDYRGTYEEYLASQGLA